MSFNLNERAAKYSEHLLSDAATLGVAVSNVAGARVVDCGVNVPGGLPAGLAVAKVCLADLAEVSLQLGGTTWMRVHVATWHPVAACLASQYAGWKVQEGKWFGMGSGPMRAAYGREPLFDDIGHRERAERVVGVLEARKLPGEDVVLQLADKLALPPVNLTLWVAPTSSTAGSLQIVARSVETALHKLHELKFDLRTIEYAWGMAPLPPKTDDDLVALGWTNDAILYEGFVHLKVNADDDVIAAIGPRVPSNASPEYGTPFGELFKKAAYDFYKLDPHLFAPAEISIHNVRTDRSFHFGRAAEDVVRRSFGL